jgi:hypothetical protein
MSRGICEDPPAAVIDAEQRGAHGEDLFLSLVEVRDLKIEMKLLRVRRIWPPRGLVAFRALEGEYKAKASVQGREVLAHCPPGVWVVHSPAKQRPVEHGEFQDVGAVQDHALELADHDGPPVNGR